ncbi:PD-(D/E)XK nuclease family protein [Alicyclobacillus vulcanalis]|uniref:DNA helicase/exodeoxyribonuclease V, subunit B n=1 Tax=Alicyclobacillus vulcanalis TaxID=252246 RepID=A0A1N7L2R0_9BACL|nr:PD-(D/E)XK nuclease family protein [Alicyclobacillus vulcanalis]SIS68071.1 DNA helicase/exodeoxyribonuclease V, subunit B [Alicyclobacillus vulcanalis]
MSHQVEWWIGAAGSGKSSRIASELALAQQTQPFGSPVLWVVPESTAFAAETQLMERLRAAFRVEVVTMRRLADRLCAQGGMARPRLTQVGRQLVLRAAYDELRTKLGPLRRAVRNPSLYHHILAAFDELTEHGVSAAQLAALLEMSAARSDEVEVEQRAVHQSLVGKLGDILKLYVRYQQLAEAAGFGDPALLYADAAQAAAHVAWLEEATLYFDGFHRFLPAERRFIASLAQRARRVVITWDEIGLDEEQWRTWLKGERLVEAWPHLADWLDQFEDEFPSESCAVQAYHQIECARDFAMASLAQTLCLLSSGAPGGRFSGSPLVAFERALAGQSPGEAEPIGGVRVSVFRDRAEELGAVADEIAHLVHREGVRPRDIAVCVPALDGPGRSIADELELRGVPVSIDRFSTLADHPVGQLLRAAIQVARTGFGLDAVAQLLRCPLVRVKRREAFDLYLREHGVQGHKSWLAPEAWAFAALQPRSQSGLTDEEADAQRRALAAGLAPAVEVFAQAFVRPADVARALWQLMEAFGVKEALARNVVRLGQAGEGRDPMASVVEEQAWSAVTGLLDDLATLQPEVALPSREVADLVLESLAAVRLTRIPSDADAVFVCDFARADNWARPRVFVVGADDASLPPRIETAGILRDDERLAFAEVFQRPLGRTSEDERRALACLPYRVLTRAAQALVVTCAESDGGIERHLSPAVAALVDRGVVAIERVGKAEAMPVHPAQALRLLADALSRMHAGVPLERIAEEDVVQDVLTHVFAGAGDAARFERVLQGLSHRPRPWQMPAAWVRTLYGDPVRVSVSCLETHAKCPYRHFAQYGLRLEPLELQPEAERDAGTWIHTAVQMVTQQLAEAYPRLAGRSGAELDQALAAMAKQALEEAAEETRLHAALSRTDAAVYKAYRERHFGFVVQAIWMQLARGQMRPMWLEKEFRDVEMGVWNGTRVLLDGRIDRVDRLAEGELALAVYDYKSSETALHPAKVHRGLQLQLLLYAAIAMREAEALEDKPARLYGVFYMPLTAKRNPLDAPPKTQESPLGAYRAKGFFLRDPAAVVRVHEDLAPGGDSVLYSKQFRKDGDWAANATAWHEEEWQAVLGHVERRAKEAAEAIASGKVTVSPYHLSHEDSGCTHCPYNALCHFERADHFDLYRAVPKLRFEDVIAEGRAES